jgi:hypothetical protein
MNRVPTELAIRESQVYFRISKAQGYYCGHYRHVVPYGGMVGRRRGLACSVVRPAILFEAM